MRQGGVQLLEDLVIGIHSAERKAQHRAHGHAPQGLPAGREPWGMLVWGQASHSTMTERTAPSRCSSAWCASSRRRAMGPVITGRRRRRWGAWCYRERGPVRPRCLPRIKTARSDRSRACRFFSSRSTPHGRPTGSSRSSRSQSSTRHPSGSRLQTPCTLGRSSTPRAEREQTSRGAGRAGAPSLARRCGAFGVAESMPSLQASGVPLGAHRVPLPLAVFGERAALEPQAVSRQHLAARLDVTGHTRLVPLVTQGALALA